jgi:hypothetical protein
MVITSTIIMKGIASKHIIKLEGTHVYHSMPNNDVSI